MILFINFTFLSPPALLPWIIGLTIIAWIWLIWKSVQREPKRWLGIRIGLLSVALLSLLLAGLQPARLVEISPEMAILITESPDKLTLDSLQKEYPGIALFELGNKISGATNLPDIPYLQRHYPDIRQLFVVGNGLHTSDLNALESYRAHFLLNPLPEGIIELSYTNPVTEGKPFQIEGFFHHLAPVPRRLVLESPSGNVDLLALDTAGTYAFKTAFPAKETGRYLFELRTEGAEKQIIEEQVLPVEIVKAKKPAILILNAAPAFETNYLKNWLADAAYPVAVRSTISRDKFRAEFHNRPALDLQSLTLDRLQQFDVLLVSTYTLANLPSRERNLTQQAIDAGLGLSLLAETPFPPATLSRADRQYFLDFPLQPGLKSWSVNSGLDLVKVPLSIGRDVGVSPLKQGNNQENIAAFQLKGKGRIALNLVTNTYQFLLNGQKEAYQNFWTPILEQTARQLLNNARWSIPKSPVLTPNAPLTFELWGAGNQPMAKVRTPDSLSIPLFFRQAPFDGERWEATYWPEGKGWYWVGEKGERGEEVKGELGELGQGGEGLWFYVQEEEAWESLKLARQLRENQQWLSEHPVVDNELGKLIKVRKPYSFWWFFLPFLFASSLLWLEEKV